MNPICFVKAEIYMSAIHPIIRLANTNLDGAAELTDAQNQVLEHVKSSFQGDIVKFMDEKHNNIEPTVLVNYIEYVSTLRQNCLTIRFVLQSVQGLVPRLRAAPV